MAASPALRLVTPCTNLAEFVRAFRQCARTDALVVQGVDAPSTTGSGRLVVALANRATVLDGDAELRVGAGGELTLRFTRLDARSRGLLNHLIEVRTAEPLGPIPRHLVPLGVPIGDPAATRDAPLTGCTIELLGPAVGAPRRAMPALPTLRGRPGTAPPGRPGTPSSGAPITAPSGRPGTPSSGAPITAPPGRPSTPSSGAPITAPPGRAGTPSSGAPITAPPGRPSTPSSGAPITAPPGRAGTPSSGAPITAPPGRPAPPARAPALPSSPAMPPIPVASPAAIAPAPPAPPSPPVVVTPGAPRRRRESQPTLLGVKAPPTIEADTDPRRPLPVRPVPGAEFEATLHGPAPMRAPGELTSPDLRRNEGVPAAELMPSAGVTLRGAAVSVELDTGETVANPHSDDLVTDVALALPDDLGTEDIDPLAEPPAPAIMPPRGVSLAVSKGSAVPRPVAHVLAEAAAAVSGPTPGLDTAVTAPMAVPPMAMIDDSAPTSAAPAPVAPASTGPTGPSRLAPAAPPVMPSGTGSTPVPTPGGWATPSWSPVPVAAAAPPAPALATSPPRAPGPAPQPPPAAPPSVPVYAQPPAKPVSAPVYPPAPGVYVDPSLAAATYQAAPAPPIYPTAQLPALDYQPPAGTSSSWQRHRAMVADEGGDMTEIISVVSVRRRRWPVIAITSAVVVVIAIVVLAITSRSGASDERPRPPAPTPAPTPGPSSTGVAPTPAPTDVAPAPTDVAPAPTDVAPAPTEVAPATAPPAPSDACAVTFTSSPDGATVLIAGAELGTTPITVEVPCATRAATFRRDRYQTRTQPLTLAPGAQTVSARLERPTFSVTIASAPKGAKVTVGGRAVGVTPVTIQVPGFEGMPVEVVLRGFAPHRERVYATRSGQRLDIRLRRR